MSQTRQRAAFEHLMTRFHASSSEPAEQRWRYLEAAHVIGQNRFTLHWRAHWQMLAFARQLGDAAEARGQWHHLAMVLFAHAVRRMAHGNIGRAVVAPLRPMVPSAQLRELMTQAMAATE